MPQVTVHKISLNEIWGELNMGNNIKKEFNHFISHPYKTVSTVSDYPSQNTTVPREYHPRQTGVPVMIIMGAVLVLLVIIVVLVWVLIKKSVGEKGPNGMGIGGAPPSFNSPVPGTASQSPNETYDLKDKEIDRKAREIERKEMEIERKEKDLEREREKRQKLSSKLDAERRNFELQLNGTKEELKKLQEDREKLQRELEIQQSKYDIEMRRAQEQYDAKAAAVRKRFEEQLAEFETSQKQFWPEVFREAHSLNTFCECVKDSFAEGSNTAAALYAELVSMGSRLGDMQAFVNQISPVGKALYAWIYDTGRTGDGFDSLLAQWLTEKVSSVDLKVVAVQPGEAYNNSIHDCTNLNGNSVSKVLSFLILGKSNRTELKAIVEVS